MPQSKLIPMSSKDSPVVAIVDHWSCKLVILFKDTGQAAFIPYEMWEHVTSTTSRKKVRQPHHKLRILLPEENVIITNSKGELTKKLKELTAHLRDKEGK